MPDFSNLVKNGWHPEKKGASLKGQMKGLVGRGDKDEDRSNYVARPMSSLKDPASFAPPPKRTADQPLPPPISRTGTASSSGAPGPPSYDDSNRYAGHQQYGAVEEEEEAPAPPKPYRVDTTGLSTSHLPPPPKFNNNRAIAPPPPAPSAGGARAGPPSLPPRLPPRTPSAPSTPVQSPAPTGGSSNSTAGGYLNQGAMNRLGAAGVSVPGFGIGRSSNTDAAPAPAPPPARTTASPTNTHMNELQNRFSKLGKPSLGALSSSSSPSAGGAAPPPAEGTTMEQKQAAMRTASNFHKDPSSVSMADARSAAGTFNNFRQRHGDQVAAGVKSANGLNQKYGIADRVGGYTAAAGAGQVGAQQEGVTGRASPAAAPATSGVGVGSVLPPPGILGKKKPPPPPPPKKKPALAGVPQVPRPAGDEDGPPPPIPMSTRPQW
ncbi:hypothetical protein ACHAQA_001430 [Verticillium albo-atrum]